MRKQLRGIKERIIIRHLLGASVGSLAVFVLGFILLPTLAGEASATTASLDLSWEPTSLIFDPDVAASYEYEATSGSSGSRIGDLGHGDIFFNTIIPTSRTDGATSASNGNVGTLKLIKKTLSVETSGRYFTIYLSTAGSSNGLAYTGDSLMAIPAISSSFSSPSVFSSSAWGYAVPGIEDTGIDSAPTYATSSLYSTGASLSSTTEGLTYAIAREVYSSVTFSPVPNVSSAQQIWKATTNNHSGFGGQYGDTNNQLDIYYGLMVDDSLISGAYSNQIVYTVMASATDLDNVSTNLSFNRNYGAGGEEETLTFDLAYSLNSQTITSSDVEVYLVKHSDMVNAEYDVTTFTTEQIEEIEENECIVASLTVTPALATGGSVSLTCTIPTINEVADDGETNKAIYEDEEATSEEREAAEALMQAGRYDFWVYIPAYNISYVSQVQNGNDTGELAEDTREAFAYVGLQSRYVEYALDDNTHELALTLNPYITEMQEMKSGICRNTTTYSSPSPLATTFSLTDVRDDISYEVRKLGSDCWMVSNLRFVGTYILPETTDINIPKNLSYSDVATVRSYDAAAIHSGNDNTGQPTVWYNFAAASAMTITGSNNTAVAEHSLCPKGWRMPLSSHINAVADYTTAFSPVYGGYYETGLLQPTTIGLWHSATTSTLVYPSTNRLLLNYSGGALHTGETAYRYGSRNAGFYLRCVARN